MELAYSHKQDHSKNKQSSRAERAKSYAGASSGMSLFLRRNINSHSIPSGTIQTALRIAKPVDKYEQEADRVAEQVAGHENVFFKPRFEYDFSKVKIHTDVNAETLNHELNAYAFTIRDLYEQNANLFAEKAKLSCSCEGGCPRCTSIASGGILVAKPLISPATGDEFFSQQKQRESKNVTLSLNDNLLPDQDRSSVDLVTSHPDCRAGFDIGSIHIFPRANARDRDTNIFRTAAEGLTGAGKALPHLSTIQRSFGRHDMTGVSARVGSSAMHACEMIGAEAYTFDQRVAFSVPPSLLTAAHEAAHVVQQRAGARPPGLVRRPADALERHADAVAKRVAAGQPAERLLEQVPGAVRRFGAAQKCFGASESPALQRKIAVRSDPDASIYLIKNERLKEKIIESGKDFVPFIESLLHHGNRSDLFVKLYLDLYNDPKQLEIRWGIVSKGLGMAYDPSDRRIIVDTSQMMFHRETGAKPDFFLGMLAEEFSHAHEHFFKPERYERSLAKAREQKRKHSGASWSDLHEMDPEEIRAGKERKKIEAELKASPGMSDVMIRIGPEWEKSKLLIERQQKLDVILILEQERRQWEADKRDREATIKRQRELDWELALRALKAYQRKQEAIKKRQRPTRI